MEKEELLKEGDINDSGYSITISFPSWVKIGLTHDNTIIFTSKKLDDFGYLENKLSLASLTVRDFVRQEKRKRLDKGEWVNGNKDYPI